MREAVAPVVAPRTVEVDTPEQVVLQFELADLGSRFLALVIDWMLIALILTGLGVVGTWLGRLADIAAPLASLGAAVLILVGFSVMAGYFFWFEAFHQGRTPGKRRVGLRVVHDGGFPLTVRGAAIRNVVRIVDVQPFFTCLAGGLSMMLHPQTKRLGDLAAATLVVRDRGEERELPEEAIIRDVDAGRPVLSDEEFRALDRFVARQSALEESARDRLTLRLGDALADHLPPSERPVDPMVERLTELHAGEARRRRAHGGAHRGSRQAALLLRSNRDRWDEYRTLMGHARDRGLSTLPDEDVSRFAALHRLVAADLARVRAYGGSGELALVLERLVAEGHNLFYRPAERSWLQLRRWVSHGFPRLVRRRWVPVALAACALFGPGVVTWATVREHPLTARQLLPAGMIERAEVAPARLATGEDYVDPPGVFMPVMSSGLIANNVRVTLLVFAGGVLAGVGSLAILALNGIFLGAVVGLYDVHDASVLLWTFVAPHGVLELTAICIAGAAGLWMGSALVMPGRRSRPDALAERAREAVSLLAGTTLLLILAGLIEGFVSPAPIPVAAKLSVAAVVGLTGILWLLLSGRDGSASATSPKVKDARGT